MTVRISILNGTPYTPEKSTEKVLGDEEGLDNSKLKKTDPKTS